MAEEWWENDFCSMIVDGELAAPTFVNLQLPQDRLETHLEQD